MGEATRTDRAGGAAGETSEPGVCGGRAAPPVPPSFLRVSLGGLRLSQRIAELQALRRSR